MKEKRKVVYMADLWEMIRREVRDIVSTELEKRHGKYIPSFTFANVEQLTHEFDDFSAGVGGKHRADIVNRGKDEGERIGTIFFTVRVPSRRTVERAWLDLF
jgi:hypothetical protein